MTRTIIAADLLIRKLTDLFYFLFIEQSMACWQATRLQLPDLRWLP